MHDGEGGRDDGEGGMMGREIWRSLRRPFLSSLPEGETVVY